MVVSEIVQYAIAALSGGAGLKLIEVTISYFNEKKQKSIEIKRIDSEQKLALTRLELESEDKLRLELWERIKNLEAKVSELDRKEQECWDKYNTLFKSNAEIAAELNYVKTILHNSSSEIMKLLPKNKAEENKK